MYNVKNELIVVNLRIFFLQFEDTSTSWERYDFSMWIFVADIKSTAIENRMERKKWKTCTCISVMNDEEGSYDVYCAAQVTTLQLLRQSWLSVYMNRMQKHLYAHEHNSRWNSGSYDIVAFRSLSTHLYSVFKYRQRKLCVTHTRLCEDYAFTKCWLFTYVK